MPLAPEQAGDLLKDVQGHEFEQLLAVMLATGLRIGETLGLRWQDIDLDKRRFTFASNSASCRALAAHATQVQERPPNRAAHPRRRRGAECSA